jgi:cytochrome c biogenesis protein CcmG/thiol:disulfide interchange protein DsbE
MNSRWVIAGAAALALGLLTLPMLKGSGKEQLRPAASGNVDANAEEPTCDRTSTAKLDFVLKDHNDVPVKMADYKGKVVILNFWATWCGPCKEEIPTFVELYDRYKDKGLVIVGVSIDDSVEQLRPFMKEWRMQYPVLQMNADIETAYGPFYGVPMTFFIARDGSICRKHMGPVTKEQFEREIRALL